MGRNNKGASMNMRELERQWEDYIENLEEDEEGMSFGEFIEVYKDMKAEERWERELDRRCGIDT
jgi:hypothetical protein